MNDLIHAHAHTDTHTDAGIDIDLDMDIDIDIDTDTMLTLILMCTEDTAATRMPAKSIMQAAAMFGGQGNRCHDSTIYRITNIRNTVW